MSNFNLLKEIEEFDKKLKKMNGDEVMEMLVENGYGKIDSPEEHDYYSIFGKGISINDASELLITATKAVANHPEPIIEVIEVTVTDDECTGKHEMYEYFYNCPKCKIKAVAKNDNYCSNCGVRIKWELEE